MKKIFIAGISGCVGHYLFDELAHNPNNLLHLIVRDPKRLRFDPRLFPNVTVFHEDLRNIGNFGSLLSEMDQVVHLAADWGGNEGNLDYTLNFFSLLKPEQIKKVIYFSTASILGEDNRPVEAAEKFGTHYIRSKYRLFNKLTELPIYPRITTLFPTWVLGGDSHHPFSHALQGIIDMRPWLRLIRFFTADVSFHYIHARDLARITRHLLENETGERQYVLGNEVVTATEVIDNICRYFDVPVYIHLPISTKLVRLAAALTRHNFHPWDLYSLEKRHFIHQTVNAPYFGLPADLVNLPSILNLALKK